MQSVTGMQKNTYDVNLEKAISIISRICSEKGIRLEINDMDYRIRLLYFENLNLLILSANIRIEDIYKFVFERFL